MNISFTHLFALVVISILGLHETASSNIKIGRSYHDGTTLEGEGPTTLEMGPTTLKPDLTCDSTDPDCSAYPQVLKPATTCPAELECFSESNFDRPSFWEERKSLLSFPNFHGYNASEPIAVESDDSVIIQNPVVTDSGKWLKWKNCTEGMYAIGSNYFTTKMGSDNMGVTHLEFLCRTPGRNKEKSVIKAGVPGLKRPKAKERKSSVCTGVIVGFQLKVLPPKGKDEISTSVVNPICSITAKKQLKSLSGTVFHTSSQWTAPAFCGKYQAMCGMQAQMQEYKKKKQDNTGMNNLRIKCCHVEDPLGDCEPSEERIQIRTCDNTGSDQGLQCQYIAKIGLSLEAMDEEEEKAIIFYSSIGYDFFSIKDKMKDKIISKLKENKSAEYSWDNVNCNVKEFEMTSLKTICVKPSELVEIYRVVGRCGYFIVRTNQFVKVIEKEGKKSEEYFYTYLTNKSSQIKRPSLRYI